MITIYFPVCPDCDEWGPKLPELTREDGEPEPHATLEHGDEFHVLVTPAGERFPWQP